MFSRLMNLRVAATIAGLLIISTAVYGFAAANIVPETGAGDGQNTISGYTVSAVTYALEASDTDPSTMDRVTFDLAATAGALKPATVKAQVVNGGSWYVCTTVSVTSPWTYNCTISPSVTVVSANQLRVVAAQ